MKIGTIGTGSIVSWVMTEALRADGMEWGAVCSRREETGRALADRFGVAKVYTDLDAMLADEALDFIYVASPNSLHYAQTRRALLAGKNVICEKPFAPTRAQAEELAALAQEKGAKIAIPAPSACSLGTTLPEFQPHFHALKPQCLIIGLAQPYCD